MTTPSRRTVLVTATTAWAAAVLHPARAETTEFPDTPLRPLADARSIRLGSAIDIDDHEVAVLRVLYDRHCNAVTPRNILKWSAVENRPGVFNLEPVDRLIAYAKSRSMAVHGHCLVWHKVPAWVTGIRSPRDLERALSRHIRTLVSHYAGRIRSWDVVNEPLEYGSPEPRRSVFHELLGKRYLRDSFRQARAADPRAMLVLNETHLEKRSPVFDERRASFLRLIEDLLEAGTPVDAVGLQGHFSPGLDQLDEEGLGRFCESLKAMGIAVVISELDASCRFVHRLGTFTDADYGILFERFVNVVAASGDLRGVTLWGMSERHMAPETGETNTTCRKRVVLYDSKLRPRSTIAGLANALGAMQ